MVSLSLTNNIIYWIHYLSTNCVILYIYIYIYIYIYMYIYIYIYVYIYNENDAVSSNLLRKNAR